MSYQKLSTDSAKYKELIKEFPNQAPFYYYYYEGDYLNKAYTEYFSKFKKPIKTEVHGYYG